MNEWVNEWVSEWMSEWSNGASSLIAIKFQPGGCRGDKVLLSAPSQSLGRTAAHSPPSCLPPATLRTWLVDFTCVCVFSRVPCASSGCSAAGGEEWWGALACPGLRAGGVRRGEGGAETRGHGHGYRLQKPGCSSQWKKDFTIACKPWIRGCPCSRLPRWVSHSFCLCREGSGAPRRVCPCHPSYGRLPGSLSAPPEMPHWAQPARPLPVRGCGGRAGGERALLCWPPPLLTALSSSAVRTHLLIASRSWAGAGSPPSSLRSSHLHPPSSQRVPGFPLSQCWQQGAGCGGWTAWVQGTEVTPWQPCVWNGKASYLLDLLEHPVAFETLWLNSSQPRSTATLSDQKDGRILLMLPERKLELSWSDWFKVPQPDGAEHLHCKPPGPARCAPALRSAPACPAQDVLVCSVLFSLPPPSLQL